MLKPLPFVWPYALIFWAAFIWAFLPEFRLVRRATAQKTAADSKSLQVIMAGGSIGTALAFSIAWWPGMLASLATARVMFVVGTLLLVLGSLLRRHCWRTLGNSFTGDVRARSDQRVVTDGAYRCVRHPSYSAGMLMNLGIGIALGSWVSAVVITVFSFAAYVYRMNVEERVLMSEIGEPYRAFASTRKRLVPFVY